MKSEKIIRALENVLAGSASENDTDVVRQHIDVLKADFALIESALINEDQTILINNGIYEKAFHVRPGDLFEQWRKKE